MKKTILLLVSSFIIHHSSFAVERPDAIAPGRPPTLPIDVQFRRSESLLGVGDAAGTISSNVVYNGALGLGSYEYIISSNGTVRLVRFTGTNGAQTFPASGLATT